MSAVICKGCGGVLAKTIYGWGHMTNPGYKHHVPTPRRAPDTSSSRARLGVPDTSPSRDSRQVNSRGSSPMGRADGKETPGTPLRPTSGGVAARADRPPRSAPDASAGRSTA